MDNAVDKHKNTCDNKFYSSEIEIEKMSNEIANGYIEYLKIDVSDQKNKLEESIEECLIHLEEVCSVLDNYKQNNCEIDDIVKQISSKSDYLNRLYNQVDALEQYIFETNKSLDQLDTIMKELENDKKISGIKQIMNLLPRISLDNRPRLIPNLSVERETTRTSEILTEVSMIKVSIDESTFNLNERLNSQHN